MKFSIPKEVLHQCRLKDAAYINRQLKTVERLPSKKKQEALWQRLVQLAETSSQKVQQLETQTLCLEYPSELPVSQKKALIAETLNQHQVIVVAGDTGSGKTTQIPKICLELGYGRRGYIGHTQPRRLAARSVAQRLADELKSPLGQDVGYQVRFSEKMTPTTRVKMMTDGLLLAQLPHDKLLLDYEVLIIDEAHERSLNIDFILGYLSQILPKRPDLKVIITSATIDVERFSKHFNQAPVIQVEGRTFPVETRYRPLWSEEAELDLAEGISQAVTELRQANSGDILIFLSGEREIREVGDYLRDQKSLKDCEVFPLYSRLAYAEQSKLFHSHAKQRLILATNVAETSLTIPNIHSVIDAGTARISRYSYRSKVQRLPIEPISQASARQRQGRCGRVAPGICIRLYAEDDFLARPEFTDPEILRTNLASVILQMHILRLGSIEDFPFVDKPDSRYIKDGFVLLEELNALEHRAKQQGQLTQLGTEMAKLPIDPRLARMVLAARQNGCLHEVMVIVCGLSIQDPRERPQQFQQASDEKHARFKNKQSDFLSFWNLWVYLQEQQKLLSNNAYRKQLKKDFLSWTKVREWQDLYQQLKQSLDDLGARLNQEPADDDSIHRALLTGLLSQIGLKDPDGHFLGARSKQFFVFPGSHLAKKPPQWLMAAQLVETSRLFARYCAQIQPEWLEPLAQHLVKKSYNEPRYSAKLRSVVVSESQALYGLPIVKNRRCQFGPIDAVEARAIFIREALVNQQWLSKEPFYVHNDALLNDIEALENKSRRRDLLVDEQALFDFYDRRLPEGIYSVALFLGWWQTKKRAQPDYLNYTHEDVMARDADHITEFDYPNFWGYERMQLPLAYQFDPHQNHDGISLTVPIAVLNRLQPEPFEWLVPGLLEEKLVAYIKGLPKAKRKRFVPAPQFAKASLEALTFAEGNLLEKFAKHLQRMTGEPVEVADFRAVVLPDHLQMNFTVVDLSDQVMASGRDLLALQHQLKTKAESALSEVCEIQLPTEQTQSVDWDFGVIESMLTEHQHGLEVQAYPTLVDCKDFVQLQLRDQQDRAMLEHRQGVKRLIWLNIPSPVQHLERHLSNKEKLALYFNPMGKMSALLQDLTEANIDLILEQAGDIRDPQAFEQVKEKARAEIYDLTVTTAKQVEQILSLNHQLQKKLKGRISLEFSLALADIKTQLQHLVFVGFVSRVGVLRLPDVLRYLKALEKRFEKLAMDVHRDRAQLLKVQAVEQAYQEKLTSYAPNECIPEALQEIRWMIEELRVSMFAQSIGTKYPVSAPRIMQALAKIR